MISYYYWKNHARTIRLLRQLGCHIMLDSGAYSAWKKGGDVSLDSYIRYIKQNQIGKVVCLDVVGDPEQSYHNQLQMEGAGLYPIPVYHLQDDIKWLDKYATDRRFIALGGTVGAPTTIRDEFFQAVFERYPDHRYHGLGMTSPQLIRKYPWFSVDSTTWLTGKKNFKLVTDSGQVDMEDKTVSVSERVAVNVRYFGNLECDIRKGRLNS